MDNNRAITDAALPHREALTKLQRLKLTKTSVTEQGVLRLAKKLPRCRVEWDGGVVQWGWD